MNSMWLSILATVGMIIVLLIAYGAVKFLSVKRKAALDVIRNNKLDNTINFVHQQINNAVYALNAIEELTGKEVPDALQHRAEQIQKVVAKVDEMVSGDIADYITEHTLNDWATWLENQVAYHVAGIAQKTEERKLQTNMLGRGIMG